MRGLGLAKEGLRERDGRLSILGFSMDMVPDVTSMEEPSLLPEEIQPTGSVPQVVICVNLLLLFGCISLFLQNDLFLLSSAIIPTRCSIRSHDSMARNLGVVIGVENITNRAKCLWRTRHFGNLFVGESLSGRDRSHNVKDAITEGC